MMEGYEEMRRGLAEAMGWRNIEEAWPESPELQAKYPRVVWWGRPPAGPDALDTIPDPLHRAEDAEALEAWLVGQFHVFTEANRDFYSVRVAGPFIRDDGSDEYLDVDGVVGATDEPNPALRRRQALVLAAWQAVQQEVPRG